MNQKKDKEPSPLRKEACNFMSLGNVGNLKTENNTALNVLLFWNNQSREESKKIIAWRLESNWQRRQLQGWGRKDGRPGAIRFM